MIETSSRSRGRRRAVGKRVRGSLYVHIGVCAQLGEEQRAAIAAAEGSSPDTRWTVARLDRGAVGLLLYEDFDDNAFPALLHAVKVDLTTWAVHRTDYRHARNPFILHRKEETVAIDDPRVPVWSALTERLEAMGLFADCERIGRRNAWVTLLREKGLEICGSSVCQMV